MARSSKTDQSLFILATQLLRHCRTHRLMQTPAEPLDHAAVLDAVSDAVDLFEGRIETMPSKTVRGQANADSTPDHFFHPNCYRGT